MNQNIRSFATDVEERLKRAYKAGNYSKKFGFDNMSATDYNEDELYEESKDQQPSSASNSAFDRILNKDNTKLNRMQNQARNYLANNETSKMSMLSSAHSQGSLGTDSTKIGANTRGPVGRLRSAKQRPPINPNSDLKMLTQGTSSAGSNKQLPQPHGGRVMH